MAESDREDDWPVSTPTELTRIPVTSEANSPTSENVMRHKYKEMTPKDMADMKSIKDIGLAFHELCDALGPSREMSIAKTKIEEAVMWAVKGITS